MLLGWWDKANHPEGLKKITELHQDILPFTNNLIAAESLRSHLSRDNLYYFLQAYKSPVGPYTIIIPQDAEQNPHIKILREMCQNILSYVVET